ncbi:hypothetical protein D9M69_402040 [compost metagenome]
MIRPIPFWPSLEPCTKLTAMAERTSTRRFQNGGCFLPLISLRFSGVTCIFDCGSHHFRPISSSAATANPAIGETTREMPMSMAFCQLTPSAREISVISALPMPTPRIAPIRVCELDAGMPKYQVPRFQAMAAASSEKTIARPWPVLTLISSSTGSRWTMA